MKLYDENMPAPNPRRVRIFLAEKGIAVPRQRVAMMKREHKRRTSWPGIRSARCQCWSWTTGLICRNPSPSAAISRRSTPPQRCSGATRASRRLWTCGRGGWSSGCGRPSAKCGSTTIRVPRRVNPNQFPEYGARNRKIVASAMKWLDGELADGRAWLAGDAYSMADIVLLTGVDFAKFVNMEMPEGAEHLRAWHARASARPSASA